MRMNRFNSKQTLKHITGLVWFLGTTALVGVGCGPGTGNGKLGSVHQGQIVLNGMDDNGYDDNGMKDSLLTDNGLNASSLNPNEFDTPSFDDWIRGKLASSTDPEDITRSLSRGLVMAYVVKCAVDLPDSLSWNGTVQGSPQSFTWNGNLNLLPQWRQAGHVLTASEHEVLETCLAAHVNADAVTVPISARGINIRMDTDEGTNYPFLEGAYFAYTDSGGQLQTRACHSPGNTSMPDPPQWLGQDSRRCGRVAGACPHVVSIGDCSNISPTLQAGDGCTLGADGNYTCTYDGVARATITVYLRPLP
jgi:hypothetical protein